VRDQVSHPYKTTGKCYANWFTPLGFLKRTVTQRRVTMFVDAELEGTDRRLRGTISAFAGETEKN